MADQVTKKTLLNVEINSSEAINNIAELKKQVSELRTKQKELDTSTDQGRQQYEAYGQQIKAINTASQSYQKEIQNQVKAQNEQEGSIQKLKAQLSLQTAEYNKLSAAQREAAKGQELQASIKGTSDKLKELEKSLGDNRRSVGDYELATKKLPGVFGEMQASATQAYSSIKDNLAQGKQMIAEYIAAKEAEKLAQAESAIAAQTAAAAEAKLAAAEAAGTVTAEQTAAAESARAAATTAATTATEAGTTAMKLLKIAIASTGIGILVVALGAIVAYFTSTNEGARKFQQIMNGINAVVQAGVKVLGSYGKLLFAIATFDLDKIKEGWKELGENIKNATGNIAENYKAAEQNTKNQQMMAKREREWSGERLKLLREYEDAKIMAGKRSALDDAGKEAAAKKALQINELIYQNDLKIAQNKVKMVENEQKLLSKKDHQAIQDSKNKVQEIINAHSQQQLTIGNLLGKTEQRIEEANTAEVASTKKKVSEKQKAEIKSDEAILASKIIAQGKIEEIRLSDEQYYQERKKMISDNTDAEKLIVQKQFDFHIITAEEAANALVAIEKEKTDTIADLDAKKLDLVIADLEYETEMALLQQEEQVANKQRSVEELHLSELLRIEQDRQAKEKALQLRLAAEPAKEAEIKKQIALVNQKARTETAKEDAAFEASQAQLKLATRQTNLSNEFELVKGNLNKEHELKLQQLDLDRQAEIDSAKKTGADIALINEKYAKIEQDLAAETKQKKIENVLEYTKAAQDGLSALSALNDLLSALGERELKAATEKNAAKKNDLDKQLKAGLISQQEHDYQVALSAYELDKKTDKINREAAIRDKALKATQTIINTAAAVVSMLALGPAGIPLSIGAGATGALQLAAILATPLPSSTAGTAPKISDFAATGSATGSGSDSGTSSSDKESEAAQKALDKAAEEAKKAAEKAQSEYDKAKEAAEKAIQDAKDLADKIAQQERDRADAEIQKAWEKSDAAIAEASKRADDISAKAQQALANALSALEKAQSAVLDIQSKIDKKASDKISEEEKKRIEAIEAAEKEILDAKNEADKVVEKAQKSADKAAEDAREKELAYLELLQQAQDSTNSAEKLQRAADIALSNFQSQSGMLWYQPELKAALRKQAEDAQKAADKAKEDAEKKAEKLELARLAAEQARENAKLAQQALENSLSAQSSAAEAAKQATLAAEERAKQAAEAAQRASDEEDARWQRELEAAKQAEIEAQAAVEQAKLDAEAAKKEAELAAQKKLEAELAAEERRAAYDAAQEEKRRIANEEAQAKADKTAREAQEAANNAAKAAALAAEAAALAAAAAGWTVAGTITPTDNTIIDNIDFNKNFGFNSDFKFKDASGYQSRTNNESNNLSKKDVQEAMTSAVKELKIYTTIEDIRKEDQNYTIIESRGTV